MTDSEPGNGGISNDEGTPQQQQQRTLQPSVSWRDSSGHGDSGHDNSELFSNSMNFEDTEHSEIDIYQEQNDILTPMTSERPGLRQRPTLANSYGMSTEELFQSPKGKFSSSIDFSS